jgi:hypothetical protein
MISNGPNFETKAADVIGLYLNPPAHAAVFCVDEKTAIQALDRKDRCCRCRQGVPKVTALNTNVTACSACLPHSTRPLRGDRQDCATPYQ